MTSNGLALQYIYDALKTPQIVNLAIDQNCMAVEHVKLHRYAEHDRNEFARRAIEKNPLAIIHLSSTQLDTPLLFSTEEWERLWRAALSKDGLALQFYDWSLPAPYELVKAALTQNGVAIQHLPVEHTHELWKAVSQDRPLVLAAVSSNGLALLEFVVVECPIYTNDREIVLAAVTNNGIALQWAPRFQEDKQIVLAAVTNNGNAIQFTQTLWSDFDVMLAAVKNDGTALRWMQRGNQTFDAVFDSGQEEKLVLAATTNSLKAIVYAPHHLKQKADRLVMQVHRARQPTQRYNFESACFKIKAASAPSLRAFTWCGTVHFTFVSRRINTARSTRAETPRRRTSRSRSRSRERARCPASTPASSRCGLPPARPTGFRSTTSRRAPSSRPRR